MQIPSFPFKSFYIPEILGLGLKFNSSLTILHAMREKEQEKAKLVSSEAEISFSWLILFLQVKRDSQYYGVSTQLVTCAIPAQRESTSQHLL